MEWYLPNEHPVNHASTGLTGIIFCDDNNYYIGKTGPDGKWHPQGADKAIEDINGWAYLPDAPIVLFNSNVEQDWIVGNGPVPSAFSHFLLYDHDVISIEDFNGPYFDAQNRTFKEVSHHIILPKRPLRLSGRAFIVKQKDQFLKELSKNPLFKGITVDFYLDKLGILRRVTMSFRGKRSMYLAGGRVQQMLFQRFKVSY